MRRFVSRPSPYLAAVAIALIVLIGAVATTPPPQFTGEVSSFGSYYQLRSFILQRNREYGSYIGATYGVLRDIAVPSATTQQSATGFTTTNIQVEGVDEADIVKTDGTYLYVVSQNRVFIILANPPDQSRVAHRLEYNGTVNGIFVSEERLAVIESSYPIAIRGGEYYGPITTLRIYDISDKSAPTLAKEISVNGNYVNSRLTAGYIYAIFQQPAVEYGVLGNLRVEVPTIQKNGVNEFLSPSNVYYSPSSKGPLTTYTIAMAIRISDGTSKEISVLSGFASTIYASLSNIYVTYSDIPYILEPAVMGAPSTPIVASIWPGFASNTTVFRLSISGEDVKVAATGSVPGTILNQFSMDEHDGYFRVATTSFRPEYDGGTVQVNNVYVLDESLRIVGRLEGLASKESIYAVRFMANRAYVVTFEKIDPLFSISLDDPTQPRLLDELTMPGFSQYLHPIGDGYIIGVGKEAIPDKQGDFAWFQGLKISLFHADGNGNLTEVAKFPIGDRGTDSPTLYDHKAFTYRSEKQVMALPILLAKINRDAFGSNPPPSTHGDPVWQGAYLFKVSTQGFELAGNITHISPGQSVMDYSQYVNRIVLIGDFAYTISETTVKVNSTVDLAEVAQIQLTETSVKLTSTAV